MFRFTICAHEAGDLLNMLISAVQRLALLSNVDEILEFFSVVLTDEATTFHVDDSEWSGGPNVGRKYVGPKGNRSFHASSWVSVRLKSFQRVVS